MSPGQKAPRTRRVMSSSEAVRSTSAPVPASSTPSRTRSVSAAESAGVFGFTAAVIGLMISENQAVNCADACGEVCTSSRTVSRATRGAPLSSRSFT